MNQATARQLVILLLLGFWAAISRAADVHLAVASNFVATAREIAAEFEHTSGHKVIMSTGSSGKLYAQIIQGAPFDVFLSADQAKPSALVGEGLAIPDSRFSYAGGVLVLWSTRPHIGNVHRALQRGEFSTLALAHPRLAPYGAAAVAVLNSLALNQTTKKRWVLGENIAHTYQFVHSGNADLGFISLAQYRESADGDRDPGWIVPATLHPPIRQDAVLLRRGGNNSGARAFMAFLRSEAAADIIREHGYRSAVPSSNSFRQ